MTDQDTFQSRAVPPFSVLPFMLLLFLGSGCAALIYEIVWFQLLQLVIGSSAVSLGVLLATFMGGMCLGSLALPRIISSRHHPLRVYALLEIGIGLIGLGVLYGMPYISGVYIAHVAPGFSGIIVRAVVCAICLLPPTLLMGAALPAISRWVEATPNGVSWLGLFYAGNTIGAVGGCVLAGFYLLRNYDTAVATYAAAGINGVVALLALLAAALAPRREDLPAASTPPAVNQPGAWPIYLAIALSGMSALGAEVVWTRLLSLLLGGTVYTFSIILAVLLAGLGIGSSVGALIARGSSCPRRDLGYCQLILTGAIAWTAYAVARSLPYWPINPELTTNPSVLFQVDLMRCIWAILPATCLWGASFPLALAAVAKPGDDPARLVGGVYAANTAGAILGALLFSMILIPWVGTQHGQQILIAMSAISAALAFIPLKLFEDGSRLRRYCATILACAAIATLLAFYVSAVPWQLVAYGRQILIDDDPGAVALYVGEGINSTIAVTQLPDGTRNFHVAGKIEASSLPADMRLQRMLGHLPAMLHPDPKSVLVVGCGAGVTAGSFCVHPEIEHITICEIEPLIPKHIPDYFKVQNHDVLNDRRLQIIYDDARHFVLTTHQKFDIITSDPIHPWVKGAATLYTHEYFQMVKNHLNPGGLVTQWVPLYESNLEAVKGEIATFFSVFPHGTIWSNDINGSGYDVVLLGQADDNAKINLDTLQQRLDQPDHLLVAESLGDVNFKSAIDLLATFAGQGPDLLAWLSDAQINLDCNLRLQYIAGLGLNAVDADKIYKSMIENRKFPPNLFEGSMDSLARLRVAIGKSGGPQ